MIDLRELVVEENPLFGQKPRDKGPVGLPVLDAVFPGGIGAVRPELKGIGLHAAALQNFPYDLGHGFLLKDPDIRDEGLLPSAGDKGHPVKIEAPPFLLLFEPAHHPVDIPLLLTAVLGSYRSKL